MSEEVPRVPLSESERRTLEGIVRSFEDEYFERLESGEDALAASLLTQIVEGRARLGEEPFGPAQTFPRDPAEEQPVLQPPRETIEDRRTRVAQERLPQILELTEGLHARPDAPFLNARLLKLLTAETVRALAYHPDLVAFRFENHETSRFITFIRLTEEVSLVGEGSISTHSFANVQTLDTPSARAKISELLERTQTDPMFRQFRS